METETQTNKYLGFRRPGWMHLAFHPEDKDWPVATGRAPDGRKFAVQFYCDPRLTDEEADKMARELVENFKVADIVGD